VRRYAQVDVLRRAGAPAQRRARGLDWKNDESRLKHHVLPELGDLLVVEVRARHVVDLFHKLRTDRARNLAQRTIYNITRWSRPCSGTRSSPT
jgi:hypothetical protein